MTLFVESMHSAAMEVLLVKRKLPHRPWIQSPTLELLAERDCARQLGDRQKDVQLNKDIRKRVRLDRGERLHNVVATGSGADIQE